MNGNFAREREEKKKEKERREKECAEWHELDSYLEYVIKSEETKELEHFVMKIKIHQPSVIIFKKGQVWDGRFWNSIEREFPDGSKIKLKRLAEAVHHEIYNQTKEMYFLRYESEDTCILKHWEMY